MDYAHTFDYDRAKEAILKKYQINADTYQQHFRATDIQMNEMPRELYGLVLWVAQCSVKDITEVIILEQFMRMVSPEMEVWIREHDPKTAEQAAELAEVFLSARRGARGSSYGWWNQGPKSKSVGGDGGDGRAHSKSNTYSRLAMNSNQVDAKCFLW